MALKQAIKTEYGINAEYWTIFYQCVLNERLNINLAGYLNEEAKINGETRLATREVSIPVDKTASINWGNLYQIVKKNSEEFKDAEDLM